jgi:hypothetical protein
MSAILRTYSFFRSPTFVTTENRIKEQSYVDEVMRSL